MESIRHIDVAEASSGDNSEPSEFDESYLQKLDDDISDRKMTYNMQGMLKKIEKLEEIVFKNELYRESKRRESLGEKNPTFNGVTEDLENNNEINRNTTNKNLENRFQRCRNVVQHFAENTTAHGFGQITVNENKAVKILWILVIVGCSVMLIYQVIPLVIRYMSKPTLTKYSEERKDIQKFPEIVVCNKHLKIENYKQLIVDHYDQANQSVPTDVLHESRYHQNRDIVMKAPYTYVFNQGYKLEDMVASCTSHFQRKDQPCNWTHIWENSVNLDCFVYNAAYDTNGVGLPTKLSQYLEDNIDLNLTLNRTYFKYPEIVIYVTEQGTFHDFSYTQPISLAYGNRYNLSLQKKVIKRVKNDSCGADKTYNFTHNYYGRKVITSYNSGVCVNNCLESAVAARCACLYSNLDPNHPFTVTNANLPVCPSDNACVRKHSGDFISECKMKCPTEPCTAITYEPKMNFMYVDADGATVSIRFLKNEITIEDEEYYQLGNLLGDIGGQMGLFNGFSALTMAEIVFFFAHLFGALILILRGQ